VKRHLIREFSYFGLVSVFVSFLLVTGCSKKIVPIEGASGIAADTVPDALTRSVPVEPKAERGTRESIGEERVESFSFTEEPTSGGGEAEDPFILADRSSPSETISSPEGPDRLQDAFFEFDRWVLQPAARSAMEQNSRWLAAHPEARIQIEGHCDVRGTDEYNLALGERRAKVAVNFLVSMGVERSRISFISFGEEKNSCNGKNEACYKKNRRAHFIVLNK